MLKVAKDRNFTIFHTYLFYHDFSIKISKPVSNNKLCQT